MTMFRILTVLLFSLSFAACDSADPSSPMAMVTVDLLNVSTTGNCDSATNPGDYQFQIEALDEGNQLLASIDLPNGTEYGTWVRDTFISLGAGDRVSLDQSLTFERAREDGGGFALQLSAMEWDSDTARDAAMDDRSAIVSHRYRDGSFANVIGERSIGVFGSASCNATIAYNVTVQ